MTGNSLTKPPPILLIKKNIQQKYTMEWRNFGLWGNFSRHHIQEFPIQIYVRIDLQA